MKSESIKSILRSYLIEKQRSSVRDDIDGIPIGTCGILSGEPFDSLDGRANDFLCMAPQFPQLPLDELDYAPLEPELEALAVGIGRQLSQLSDSFEEDHIDVVRSRSGSANENRNIRFKDRSIRISPTSERILIRVVRTGVADSVMNVEWRTSNKSAKAGLHYVHGEGSLLFEEGVEEKIIEVEIIKGQSRKTDICFAVELVDAQGTFNTFTVYIVDESKLYPEEKSVVDNIFNCDHSVTEVATCLSDNVTHKTFKAALLCLSGSANSIPKELALGFELLRLTIPHARLSSLTNMFCDYFGDLPELDDIADLF